MSEASARMADLPAPIVPVMISNDSVGSCVVLRRLSILPILNGVVEGMVAGRILRSLKLNG